MRLLVKRQKQTGIGLVEILITIIILSMGFLAAARMQVEGMRFSQSAYYQSQAYFLASDMINRMRTNSDGVKNGEYTNIVTAPGAQDPGCGVSSCDAAQIALQDVYEWGGYFHSRDGATNFIPALPSSESIQAYATVIAVDENIFTVRLVWSEIISGEDKEQTLTVNYALAQEDD